MAKILISARTARRIKADGKRRILRIHLLSNFLFGVVRGLGMAAGFSGIAVILLMLTRIIPITEIPLIGEIIKAIISSNNS